MVPAATSTIRAARTTIGCAGCAYEQTSAHKARIGLGSIFNSFTIHAGAEAKASAGPACGGLERSRGVILKSA